MAVYVPMEEFAELSAALEPVWDIARKLAEQQAPMPDNDTAEAIALEHESQAFLFMLQVVAKQGTITDAAQMLLFGAFVGTIMAQAAQPAELWRLFREQLAKTFDGVQEAIGQVGHA